MPVGLHGLFPVVWNNELYIAGGGDKIDRGTSTTFQVRMVNKHQKSRVGALFTTAMPGTITKRCRPFRFSLTHSPAPPPCLFAIALALCPSMRVHGSPSCFSFFRRMRGRSSMRARMTCRDVTRVFSHGCCCR